MTYSFTAWWTSNPAPKAGTISAALGVGILSQMHALPEAFHSYKGKKRDESQGRKMINYRHKSAASPKSMAGNGSCKIDVRSEQACILSSIELKMRNGLLQLIGA